MPRLPRPLTACPVPLFQLQSHSQSGNDYSISRQENLSARHRVPSKRCDKGEADCRLPLPPPLPACVAQSKPQPTGLPPCPVPTLCQAAPFKDKRIYFVVPVGLAAQRRCSMFDALGACAALSLALFACLLIRPLTPFSSPPSPPPSRSPAARDVARLP